MRYVSDLSELRFRCNMMFLLHVLWARLSIVTVDVIER